MTVARLKFSVYYIIHESTYIR